MSKESNRAVAFIPRQMAYTPEWVSPEMLRGGHVSAMLTTWNIDTPAIQSYVALIRDGRFQYKTGRYSDIYTFQKVSTRTREARIHFV